MDILCGTDIEIATHCPWFAWADFVAVVESIKDTSVGTWLSA